MVFACLFRGIDKLYLSGTSPTASVNLQRLTLAGYELLRRSAYIESQCLFSALLAAFHPWLSPPERPNPRL
ncbi:MAG: hypothetical protein F6J93_28365 [Oscillatoria sp. SIO1A7]|nr:hypothetical protein [Oscillatoria sp. SIO1A7]